MGMPWNPEDEGLCSWDPFVAEGNEDEMVPFDWVEYSEHLDAFVVIV